MKTFISRQKGIIAIALCFMLTVIAIFSSLPMISAEEVATQSDAKAEIKTTEQVVVQSTSQPLMLASAPSQTTDITLNPADDAIEWNGSRVADVTLPNGQRVFCTDHSKHGPDRDSVNAGLKYQYDASLSDALSGCPAYLKGLYYGAGGPAQWSGFTDGRQAIVYTSLYLSYVKTKVVAGTGSTISPDEVNNDVFKNFITYINSSAAPTYWANANPHLSSTGGDYGSITTTQTTTHSGGTQKSGNLCVRTPAGYSVTVTVPTNARLYVRKYNGSGYGAETMYSAGQKTIKC